MNSLLSELLQWMVNNNYRRASFDRIIGIVPSASTYNQLNDLVNENGDIFRSATMKGGFPGLALQDCVDAATELANLRKQPEEEAEPLTVGFAEQPVAPPAAPEPTMVTPQAIADEISSVHYRNLGSALKQTGPVSNVTLCVLVLRNGFVIVGKSACVDAANFNEDTGQRLAYEDALKQVWPFLGFRLADRRLAA